MHRSKWCNRKRSVGVTAHVIAPASKISDCRSFSHLFLFTILPVKRTQETRNIHSSTLLSTSMATKGCGIFCISFSCPRSRSWTHRIVAGHTTTFHHFQGWKPSIGFQQNRHLEIGAQFEPGTGGIEPPTFCLQAWVPYQLRHIWVASPSIQERLLHSHPSPATQIQTPKSKIQNPNGPFGFWILDFGVWILDFGSWILDFGFWISDFGFRILDCRSIRSLCGSPKRGRLDFGFWILDLGFWILDFGFWILDFGFWILDFGFRILDFGFGFWILDLGFWILDFGFWILDFGFCFYWTVWILHKIIATTRRLGSADKPPTSRVFSTPVIYPF